MPEHTLPDDILKTRSTGIRELKRYVNILNKKQWKDLGIELELDESLAECIDMYRLWLQEKGTQATRKNLIDALRAIKLNAVADEYVAYLKVSNTVKDNLLNVSFKLHC